MKRAFDFCWSLVCLLLFSPLFLGCYIAIRLEDGGPAFFTCWIHRTQNRSRSWNGLFRKLLPEVVGCPAGRDTDELPLSCEGPRV